MSVWMMFLLCASELGIVLVQYRREGMGLVSEWKSAVVSVYMYAVGVDGGRLEAGGWRLETTNMKGAGWDVRGRGLSFCFNTDSKGSHRY